MVCIMRSISSQGISAQDKMEIMQQAVAKCPKISVASMGVQIPSLLDSGSEVFINQTFILQRTSAAQNRDANR